MRGNFDPGQGGPGAPSSPSLGGSPTMSQRSRSGRVAAPVAAISGSSGPYAVRKCALTCGFSWSQGDLNPRPLACHLPAASSSQFTAVQTTPLTWTDAEVLVRACSYPSELVAAVVAAIGVVMLLVLFGLHQMRASQKLKWDRVGGR